MLRIFRHYIPKTLILLGLAELLILFVSIYLGATFHIGSESGYAYGEGLPLWTQALVYSAAIVLGDTLGHECPSSNKWDRCAVRLSECFAHHFHVMRRVVDSANDVPRWSFV